MIEDVIQGLVTMARAQLGDGGQLEGIKEVLDFDPDVLEDGQYPALTFEWAGCPGSGPQKLSGGASDFPFEIAATLYTADVTPGAAQRQLRQLMYAGEGKGLAALLNAIDNKTGAVKGRAYQFSIGRTRTGFVRSGGTASAAASTTITVKSRGRN